jgi:nucleoid-associated protein YgaU
MTRASEGVDNWVRIFGGFASLAVLWVAVYWWWGEPKKPQAIPVGTQPAVASAERGDSSLPPPPLTPRPTPIAVPAPAPLAADSTPPTDGPAVTSPAAPSAPATGTGPTSRIEPPKFRAYIVKKGDTFQKIAAKELGSEKRWEILAKANPFVSPGTLQPGRELKIPIDPENIQGKPTQPPAGTPKLDEKKPTGAAEREYVVKAGDTLSGISKKMYGESRHAELIFQANRDVLKQADDLRPGQKLKIPPKPDAGQVSSTNPPR